MVGSTFQMTAYDPIMKVFSNVRHARYMLSEKQTADKLIEELNSFLNATIRKIVSHDPIQPHGVGRANEFYLNIYQLADSQRVFVQGVPYIDQFGYHVYITPQISIIGEPDVDMRDCPVPEEFTLKGIPL